MSKIAKWRTFSEEEFAKLVSQSVSFQDLASKLGYISTGGGTAQALRDAVKERNLDTSHFLGQGWSKNNFDYSRFQYGKTIKGESARRALAYKRGWKCEKCGLSTWLDQPIALEVHHKDGNHINNSEENLQLLCPNCHAQTENYRGKNIKRCSKLQISDEEFVDALQKSGSVRQSLLSLGLSCSGPNYERAYRLISQYNISYLKKE